MGNFAFFVDTIVLFSVLWTVACQSQGLAPAPPSNPAPLSVTTSDPTRTPAPVPTPVIPSTATPEILEVSGGPLLLTDASSKTRLFRIVPETSEARYEVEEILFRIFRWNRAIGRTRAVQGEFRLTSDGRPVRDGNWFKVDISTLTSNSANRDRMIQAYWLESEQNPLAEFIATAIEPSSIKFEEGQAVRFKLAGNMTIRQTTRPLTFEVEAALKGDTISGTAQALLRMKDFDFDPPEIPLVVWVEDSVDIVIEVSAKVVTP